MLTLDAAIVRLEALGVLSPEPRPTTEFVQIVLAQTARAAIRAASTAYVFGDKVVPLAGNGRIYRAVVAGTSNATLPVWPTTSTRTGQRVYDGTATWEDVGPAHSEIYDLNAATREIWLWRAAQLAQKFDISDSSASLKRSQMYGHALTQARRYGARYAL